jgi:hypothetical protein
MIPRVISGPAEEEDDPKEVRTRAGYKLPDVVRAVDKALSGTGTDSLGRLFHHTADLIASGGKDIWMRLCFEHAVDHVGLASPKLFKYLRTRFRELEDVAGDLETEAFYRNPAVQRITGETIYVIQQSRRSPKPKMPTTPQDTHRGPWLRASLRAGEMAVVRRVWQSGQDALELRSAGNELVYAVQEGALERALFWMKWMFDEDTALKKEMKEMGIRASAVSLTTVDRAGAGGKMRNYVAQYMAVLCAEMYKDLAAKGLITMHDEFQCLVELFRTPDTRISPRRRVDFLVLMLQILTEVPKWKVTSAAALVNDPVALQRAVSQVGRFYIDILQYPALTVSLPRAIRAKAVRRAKAVDQAKISLEEQESLYEEAMNRYFERR